METASSRPKAGTTAPAGSTSIFSSPPVMSLTFSAKSSAYSWKMSLLGQVLWKRICFGVCALAIIGAASAVPAAAPRKVLRVDCFDSLLPFFIVCLLCHFI